MQNSSEIVAKNAQIKHLGNQIEGKFCRSRLVSMELAEERMCDFTAVWDLTVWNQLLENKRNLEIWNVFGMYRSWWKWELGGGGNILTSNWGGSKPEWGQAKAKSSLKPLEFQHHGAPQQNHTIKVAHKTAEPVTNTPELRRMWCQLEWPCTANGWDTCQKTNPIKPCRSGFLRVNTYKLQWMESWAHLIRSSETLIEFVIESLSQGRIKKRKKNVMKN